MKGVHREMPLFFIFDQYFINKKRMKILKFGGTSVGSASRIKELINIIPIDEKQIIVLSAVSGTTNALVEIAKQYQEGNKKQAQFLIKELEDSYFQLIEDLFSTPEGVLNGKELITFHFNLLKAFSESDFSNKEEKIILAQGELLSTNLFHFYLTECGIRSVWLPALDFMKVDEDHEPDVDYIREHVQDLLLSHSDHNLFITQGYICRNNQGEIDNLKRGGSDYTASLIGAAILAEEVQIWTDIDGIHNNDPRVVQGTKPIRLISFNEAAELAYFGAKILHPQCVFPARKYKVPVRILNTMDPNCDGTLVTHSDNIVNEHSVEVVTAIAAKDNITAIRIHSSRMLLAYGFLRRVFEVFEKFKTPIDMITTSEVAVSLTIDDDTYLNQIIEELQQFGHVDIDTHQSIVCVVGNFTQNSHGYASRVLDAVKHLPIRMISYGGSQYNISILINTSNKVEALRSLHNRIFY